MHNKIKEIANFQTYFGKLQDNIPVASLILPSGMRSYKYPNSFKVNPSNGVVTLKSKEKSKIVPNNVIKESSSVIFRSACQKNQKHMSELTFESGMLWGFEQALVDWMYYLPREYKHATIYGGEILCDDMLSNICYAMQRTPDIKMVIYTYNDGAVQFVRNKKIISATDKGIEVIQKLPLQEVKSAELTAKWEQRLNLIENGLDYVEKF